jgi:hypothetical protein
MCPLPRASDMTAPGRSPRPGGSAGRIATVLRSRAAPEVQCGALPPRGPQGSRRDPLLDPREDALRDAGLVAKGRGRHRRREPPACVGDLLCLDGRRHRWPHWAGATIRDTTQKSADAWNSSPGNEDGPEPF